MPQGQAKKEMKLTLTWHKLCCSLNEYTRLVTFFNSYIYIYIYISISWVLGTIICLSLSVPSRN
jgi:hypothetical protein